MTTHISSGAGNEVGLGTSSLAGGCCQPLVEVRPVRTACGPLVWQEPRAPRSPSPAWQAPQPPSLAAPISHTPRPPPMAGQVRGPGGCSEALLWGAGTGVGPCLAAATPTHGVGMGAVAGCILPGLTLVVRMGARTVWTSSTPSLSGNAGGGGSGAGQNPIRAARFLILCLPRSIRSGSSSCWQRDTAGCSSAMPPAGFRHYFK